MYGPFLDPRPRHRDQVSLFSTLLDGLKDWNLALMDRLSLWYTKITHLRLFWLGLLIAVLINVDSIQLFSFFNQNPKARTTLIDYYHRDSAYLQSLTEQLDSLPSEKADSVQRQFMKKMSTLADATGLPIGFSHSIFQFNRHTKWQEWLLKVLGLLISAFAASKGGPFWFDLLKKALSFKPRI
jgi:hypothetical protein